MTFDIKEAQYRTALNDLVREKRANAQLLLREEARLFVRDVIDFTPPRTKSIGLKAVAKDLAKVYATAAQVIRKAKEMGARGMAVALSEAMRQRDYAGFAALLMRTSGATETVRVRPYTRGGKQVSGYTVNRSIVSRPIQQWGGGSVNNIVDPAFHLRRRRPNGRVAGERWSQIVFDAKSLSSYVKMVQSRVGWAKAGWAATAARVGHALPAFIRELAGKAPGNVIETGAPSFSITMVNRSSAIPNYQERVVNPALRRRYVSLVKEAQRILAGGKSRRGSFAGTSTGAPN